MRKLLKEFSEFIKRGNVIDLAVAVVMGQAFSSIVNSMVNDLIMPLAGILIGGIDFTKLEITLGNATIHYGKFVQSIVNFLIIAAGIFVAIKFLNHFMKNKEKDKEKQPMKKNPEILLLEEIRDNLKDIKKTSSIK